MSNPPLQVIADQIMAAERPEGMVTRIVGIDGCGGSGKSTLARNLAKRLAAPVIHTDDFATPETPLDWYGRFMAQVISPLRQNKPARYQRYDWGKHALAEWHDVPAGGTVIIEGVSATRALFRPALTFCLYVETPRDIRLQRGLARDGAEALTLWQSWQEEEDQYLAEEGPATHANMIIDGTCPVI